jgi:hypothetical protein
MRLRHLSGFLAAGIFAACFLPTDSCACLRPPASALAIGTVTVASGDPAPNAMVAGETWRPPCDVVPPQSFGVSQTTADARGAFRLVVIGVDESLHCVRVTARLGTVATSRIVTVGMRADPREDQLDSVRVELMLP